MTRMGGISVVAAVSAAWNNCRRHACRYRIAGDTPAAAEWQATRLPLQGRERVADDGGGAIDIVSSVSG
jgi:hypothetical protein